MKKKQFFTTIILFILISLLSMTTSKAVQSRPNVKSLTNVNASNFFSMIRQMETSEGPMGLNVTVDATGTETSGSNNIDVHMIKNTEWGVMAMLSASSYGQAPSGKSDASTTGNNTGVFQTADDKWEFVAGMWNSKNSYNENIYHSEEKYWDKYIEEKNRIGDATLETNDWKGANYKAFVMPGFPLFARDCIALFGYDSRNGTSNSYGSSRATIVCGVGF